MKSASVKKVLSSLLLALMLGLFVTSVRPVSAEAATVSLTRKNFSVSYIGSSSVSFKLALPYSDIQGVVQLFENGKLVGKTTASSYATIDYAVKKNKTYFYRVRPILSGQVYRRLVTPKSIFDRHSETAAEIRRNENTEGDGTEDERC